MQDMPSENKGLSVKNILHDHFTKWILSKILLSWFKEIFRARIFFRNHAGSWYFYLLLMHVHQVTLLSGPGHLHIQQQHTEGEPTNPTRNRCAKYALSKIWVSRCFAPLDWCRWHFVSAQTRSWLKLCISVFSQKEWSIYFWDTLIRM